MNRTLITGLQNRSNTIIRKGHLASSTIGMTGEPVKFGSKTNTYAVPSPGDIWSER